MTTRNLSNDTIFRAKERRDAISEWLKMDHPQVFKEQLHTHEGTSERAYWHHGYMMALADILRAVQESAVTN